MGPKTERLTISRAATHETELGDYDFCLSRSHYTDTGSREAQGNIDKKEKAVEGLTNQNSERNPETETIVIYTNLFCPEAGQIKYTKWKNALSYPTNSTYTKKY